MSVNRRLTSFSQSLLSTTKKSCDDRPFVSVVVPAYNEAEILVANLTTLCEYLDRLEDMYRWEVIVVNDGSTDDTGPLADAFADGRENVRVLHHRTNFQLGQALRYAFSNCRGDYVVTIDCDLSYAPEHIGRLVTELRATNAKSRYRLALREERADNQDSVYPPCSQPLGQLVSVAAARGNFSTLTGMVRAYDRRFLSTLNLTSMGTDINTEILYKAELLGARVVEIPAHLDWTFSNSGGRRRRSLGTLANSTNGYLLSGFMFRPVLFFIGPGLVVLAAAVYTLGMGRLPRRHPLLSADERERDCEDYRSPSSCHTRRLPIVSSLAASR